MLWKGDKHSLTAKLNFKYCLSEQLPNSFSNNWSKHRCQPELKNIPLNFMNTYISRIFLPYASCSLGAYLTRMRLFMSVPLQSNTARILQKLVLHYQETKFSFNLKNFNASIHLNGIKSTSFLTWFLTKCWKINEPLGGFELMALEQKSYIAPLPLVRPLFIWNILKILWLD